MAKVRFISAEDLLRFCIPSDPQISQDGSTILFVVKITSEEKNKYFSHLWLVQLYDKTLKQFTFGEVNDSSPRWSPDGKQIAFIRTKDKQTQIWLIPTDGGEARQLTKLDQGSISDLTWSPDGSRIAFTFGKTPDEWTEKSVEERKKNNRSNPPRIITRLCFRLDGSGFLGEKSHIWTVNVKDGVLTQLTKEEFDDRSSCWSPDGRMIAFISNRSQNPDLTPFDEDIFVVSTESGETIKLGTPLGYKASIDWSPDGKLIGYSATESKDDPWVPRNNNVWTVSACGGNARCLTASTDRMVGNYVLSDARDASFEGPVYWTGNDTMVFQISSEGACQLYSVNLKGDVKSLLDRKCDVTGFSAGKNGVISITMGDAAHPTEVFTIKNGDCVQLTGFNKNLFESIQLSSPEEFSYTSIDNNKVQGWILKPPDFNASKKYPVIFYIHGGPHALYGYTFFHEFQVHAARGYVVVYTNPRGSAGYAESFMSAIRGDWGNHDYKDMMAAVDHICKLPYVDPSRIGVAGGSYGGYSTNWIIGHTDRFKCAVTDRSVVNLVSMSGTSDFPRFDNGYWKANSWDNPEEFIKQSPLTYVANVKTPLLIIHSEGDLRCPISQAEELFSALCQLNKEVVFVRYPQESSHGMSRIGPPDLRLHRLDQICKWFDKYLK